MVLTYLKQNFPNYEAIITSTLQQRRSRLDVLRVYPHTQWDVALVHENDVAAQSLTRGCLVAEPVRPNSFLPSVLEDPDASVPVVTERARPQPAVIGTWSLDDPGHEAINRRRRHDQS